MSKPTFETMKSFIDLYREADEKTQAMVLGILIKANADRPPKPAKPDVA